MAHLTKWFGLRQIFSLVDRHESNGVECPSKLVLTLLRALVHDERIVDRWSDPNVLPLISFTINTFVSAETGYSPFELTFGRQSSIYNKLPHDSAPDKNVTQFVKLLNDDLILLRQISKEFQSKLIAKRTATNPTEPNVYQPGDFILFDAYEGKHRPSKLTPAFKGPYEVLHQRNNDVECRHLVGAQIETFHVTRVKIFHGNKDEAYKAALLDNDQYVIQEILAYRGDPLTRTTMEFEVRFEAGSIVWLPWSKELFDTVPYENFCRGKPELYVLVFGAKDAGIFVKDKDKKAITMVKPGDSCYVDLRYYGAAWYNNLGLPDSDHSRYVVQHKYTRWNNSAQTEITAECKLFDERFQHRGYFVFAYGSTMTFDSKSMIKLDAKWIKKYPQLLPNDRGQTRPQVQASLPLLSEPMAEDPPPFEPPTKQPPTKANKRPLTVKSDDLPTSDARSNTRRQVQMPSRFLNHLQEEQTESDVSSDSC
jgi:hypothetical protein